jgi:hypothetical protein
MKKNLIVVLAGLLLMGSAASLLAAESWGPWGVAADLVNLKDVKEGRVVSTTIHTCNTTYKVRKGYCNGSMRIEITDGGKTSIREFLVNSRVAIDSAGKTATLDAFPGKNVRVEFRVVDGFYTATSLTVKND